MAAEHRAAWSCSPTYRKGDWVQAVISDFHAMMNSGNADLDCLFAIFPYAFTTDRRHDSLLDRLIETIKISGGLTKELVAFMGEENE